jgi:agmatine deiminase
MTNNGPQLLDFQFDGWGGKYSAELDNQITNILHEAGLFGDDPIKSINLVLEGGSIESDGQGTVLTTQHCVFDGLRNKSLNNAQIEKQLTELFGLNHILCLHYGAIIGDDTDGHIDTLARFCDPHTIAYASCDDPQDKHFEDLKAMEDELRTFTTIDKQPYKLIPLPLPKPVLNTQGNRLPATYANFLILNGAVLVPVYGDIETDTIALESLSGCFPDREIIDVNCTPLIQQSGSLHCVTMQLY